MTITGRVERVLVLAAIAVLGAVLLAADALAKKDRTSLVSRQSASAGGLGGDDESFNPAVSANGRFVAFETHADNLGGPAVDVSQIYLYDRKRDRIRLVSRRSQSAGGAAGDDGTSTAWCPATADSSPSRPTPTISAARSATSRTSTPTTSSARR